MPITGGGTGSVAPGGACGGTRSPRSLASAAKASSRDSSCGSSLPSSTASGSSLPAGSRFVPGREKSSLSLENSPPREDEPRERSPPRLSPRGGKPRLAHLPDRGARPMLGELCSPALLRCPPNPRGLPGLRVASPARPSYDREKRAPNRSAAPRSGREPSSSPGRKRSWSKGARGPSSLVSGPASGPTIMSIWRHSNSK